MIKAMNECVAFAETISNIEWHVSQMFANEMMMTLKWNGKK